MLIDEDQMMKTSRSQGHAKLCWYHFKHAIQRNFGGLEEINPLEIFEKKLRNILENSIMLLQQAGVMRVGRDINGEELFDCDTLGLIKANLESTTQSKSKQFVRYYDPTSHIAFTRNLLIITEDHSTYCLLLQQKLITEKTDIDIIVGSKFAKGYFLIIGIPRSFRNTNISIF